MSEHPATDYFGVWQRYRKVIDANYMHHAEFSAHIEQVLRSRFLKDANAIVFDSNAIIGHTG